MSEPRDHADVKIHPPILTLIHIGVAYLLAWIIPIPLAVPGALRLVGVGCVVIGILLGGTAFYAFARARTTLLPHGSVSTIVIDGIYRFTRNPIYLAFVLMLIGFPLISGTYWGLLLAPALIFSFNRLVIRRYRK